MRALVGSGFSVFTEFKQPESSSSEVQFRCFPDTVDPRGPKGSEGEVNISGRAGGLGRTKEGTMRESLPHTLMERLDRLERENRWWRVVGVLAVGTLSVVLLVGAAPVGIAKEVRATRFVVVDEQNATRGYLGMSPFGGDVIVGVNP